MALVSPVADASVGHLAARLELIEARIRAAVARRRATDPDPDDRFRGLYVSDVQVDEMLAGGTAPLLPAAPDPASIERLRVVEAEAEAAEAAGVDVRLRRLVRAFDLQPLDVELLLVALAPDLDPRFERLYGYLHDDVSRRRASIGLALELVGAGGASGAGRARLGVAGPLMAGGLLVVEDTERPYLTRAIRVPDRVAGHLVGDDTTDPLVAALEVAPSDRDLAGSATLERGLRAGARLAYVRERIGTAPLTVAARALARLGPPPVVIDLGRLGPREEADAATAAIREARLRGCGLVAGPVDVLAERGPAAVRAFAEAACVTVLHGARGWDPAWSRTVAFLVEAELPTPAERRDAWHAALDGSASGEMANAIAALPYRLAPEQVERAAEAGRLTAAAAGRALAVGDVAAGARSQNAAGLDRLARRIEPRVGWSDLVLPAPVIEQLGELTARARHRDRVLDDWGLGRTSLKGRGVTALFAGDSGTGKTMSAEVIAGVARPGPLRDRPLDGRGQVHRRDGEEPRPGLQRGRPGRTASSSSTRPTRSSASAPRSRTPATATPTSRSPTCSSGWRASTGMADPHHEPARQRGRGVPPPARRDRRLPGPRRRGSSPALGAQPVRGCCPRRTISTSTSWPGASRSRAATSATWPSAQHSERRQESGRWRWRTSCARPLANTESWAACVSKPSSAPGSA